MLRRALLLPILLSALAGCGKDVEDYRPEIEKSEKQLGAEQHPLLLAEFGGSYDEPEALYVRRIGEKVAQAAELGGQCTFALVNSDVVNAFAVPGCYIYVTRGLMGIVNSEAELASVLAHELGHIVADHSERQQKRSLWRQLGVLAVGFVTGSEGLTRLAGNAAGYFTLRYSRKQEYESDDLGIRYLRLAGYDPDAAGDMLSALARNEQFLARTRGRDEAQGIPEWARTHPLTENRIERSREAAAATGAGDLPENERPFLHEVDGLLYGDDPQQGFVMGRRFAHPVMRIGFDAPEGFTLTNSPQAILIDGPDGMRGEFAGGRMPPGGLEDYAAAVLEQMLKGAPAQAGEAQRTRANDLPALIVPVMVRTQQGDVQINLAAYDAGSGNAYHFIIASQPGSAEAALGELFLSFRLLTPEQAASLRPRRIRVLTAGPADTLQTLAAQMASDHPLDHFLMLNGRSPDQPLRAGEMVKIVTLAPARAAANRE
jgi:predicted Zn-dependent protease